MAAESTSARRDADGRASGTTSAHRKSADATSSGATPRERLKRMTERVDELEAENARLSELARQWMMHHAHAARRLERVRGAVRSGEVSAAALLEIVDDPAADEGARALVAGLVDGLVTEWTTEPISEFTRSAVRDWLIAHREFGKDRPSPPAMP